MKQEKTDPKKLAALLKKLQPASEHDLPTGLEPTTQLVLSFLNWETTRKNADAAFEKLMAQLVDINELRVTLEPELAAIIGEDYPLALHRLVRLRETLHAIYRREHDIQMASIADKGKKEQRAYLDSLPAAPSYVTSGVMLLAFGGHAMPVDTKMASLLAREGIVEAGASPQEVEAFLLKHVRADEAVEAYRKLQAWADESRVQPDASGPAPNVPTHRSAVLAASNGGPSKASKKTTRKTTRRAKKK